MDQLATEGAAIYSVCEIAAVMISRQHIRSKLLVLGPLQEVVGRTLAQFLSIGWFPILHQSGQLSLPHSQHHKTQGLQAGPGGTGSAVSAFWEAKACLGYELKISISNSARSCDHIKSRTGLGM